MKKLCLVAVVAFTWTAITTPPSHAQIATPETISAEEARLLVEGVEVPTALVQIELRRLLTETTQLEAEQRTLAAAQVEMEALVGARPAPASSEDDFASAVEGIVSSLHSASAALGTAEGHQEQAAAGVEAASGELKALEPVMSLIEGTDELSAAKAAVLSAAEGLSAAQAEASNVSDSIQGLLDVGRSILMVEVGTSAPPPNPAAFSDELNATVSTLASLSDRTDASDSALFVASAGLRQTL